MNNERIEMIGKLAMTGPVPCVYVLELPMGYAEATAKQLEK